MKKFTALLLALALMLSLCACTTEKPQDSGSPAPGSSQPAEESLAPSEAVKDVAARLEAGEEVMIGYAVNTLANPALKQTIDNVAGFLEELGCTVSVAACEGDTALMISQVENFIEMAVDLIIVAPIDQGAMQDTLLKAETAGIPVVFNGQYPAYADQMSGGGATNYPELGTQNANIFKQIYDAMIEVLEADPRITISYTGTEHNSIDSGFNAAAEALTMDPEIRVFLCYQDNPGIGVANYLMSDSSLKMDEFGVFSGS